MLTRRIRNALITRECLPWILPGFSGRQKRTRLPELLAPRFAVNHRPIIASHGGLAPFRLISEITRPLAPSASPRRVWEPAIHDSLIHLTAFDYTTLRSNLSSDRTARNKRPTETRAKVAHLRAPNFAARFARNKFARRNVCIASAVSSPLDAITLHCLPLTSQVG